MDLLRLDNVFNYISSSVRKNQADDDQLKSWAFQAWRGLNSRERFVKDIVFLEVSNHKTVFPDYKKIQSVKVYSGTTSGLDSLLSCCESINEDAETDNPCNVNMQLFIESSYYVANWTSVRRVKALTEDYLCTVEPGCDEVYSISPEGIATFSFESGTIALEYYTTIKDDDGNFLIPSEPEVLWKFMARYAEMEHWRNRIGEQGAFQMYQLTSVETGNLEAATKSRLNHKNFDSRIAREQIFGAQRFIKLPTFVHRYYNNRYYRHPKSMF